MASFIEHPEANPVPIIDLTNTTWVFNDELNTSNGFSYDLDFISNDSFYTNMRLVEGKKVQLIYDGLIVYSDDSVTPWTNESYKTISITGGTDATNTTLINWLQSNATLQETPTTDTKPVYKCVNGEWVKQLAFERVNGEWVRISSKEEPTPTEDELVGTWVFNDTLTFIDAFSYDITFTSNNLTYTNIKVRHNTKPEEYFIMQYYSDNANFENAFKSNIGWFGEAYKTITITSKLSEVTNGEQLLTWLQSNATKQGTPTLINFTIAGTPYQAEEGMTWEQWVNSSYNTNSYEIYSSYIIKRITGTKYSRVMLDGISVIFSDIIGSNYVYTLKTFIIPGGGGGGGGGASRN